MEIFGDFENIYSFENEKNPKVYTFTVKFITRIAGNGRVLSINGKHIEDKSNDDVHSIVFSIPTLTYFPRYLCKFFPNLESISIVAGGLKKLTKYDLIGCEGIEKLIVIGNNIKSLDGDVFDYAPNIETLSLFLNEIEMIDEKIFDKMKSLRFVNLRANVNINVVFNEHGRGLKTMRELRNAIVEMKKIVKENPKMLDKIEILINGKPFNFENI